MQAKTGRNESEMCKQVKKIREEAAEMTCQRRQEVKGDDMMQT